jgi:hypothetical protein
MGKEKYQEASNFNAAKNQMNAEALQKIQAVKVKKSLENYTPPKPVQPKAMTSSEALNLMYRNNRINLPDATAINNYAAGGPIKSPVIKDYDRDEAPRQGNYLLPDINRPGYVDTLNQLRTEYRMGINDPRLNKEVLIPTVINGRQFSPDAAVDRYYNTGYHMGMFDTPEQAELASMLRTQKYNTLIDPVRTSPVLQFKKGGMIKRADGSYSKRGLWDNIRANRGSGKKPTKQMLEQERKIKAKK